MKIKIDILGCGSSSGVPAIGNYWGDCDPKNPKNKRLRSSILITSERKTKILIDATPDLRQQLLNANVEYLDAVLITHAHADHIHGVDDFRFLNVLMKKHLNLYAHKKVLDEIKKKFSYVFEKLKKEANGFYYKPCLVPKTINKSFMINELKITSFQQNHGFCESTGYRINNVAYSTDVVDLDDKAFSKLKNLDLWIVGLLREDTHPAHAGFDQIMDFISYIKPKQTIFTHMTALLDEKELITKCPPNVKPGYDGMIIDL